MWGLPLHIWGLWLVMVGAMILVACALADWSDEDRQLPRRPLPRPDKTPPPPAALPKHAAWTREEGDLDSATTSLGWAVKDAARAQVFQAPQFHGSDPEHAGRIVWPGDRDGV